MSENYKNRGWQPIRIEKDPDILAKEHLENINKILAKLIERGGDYPPLIKDGFRTQLQGNVEALGLESLEDYAGLSAVLQRLHVRNLILPTTTNYPSRENFSNSLQSIFNFRNQERLPAIPKSPTLSEIAEFGQADWNEIQNSG